MLILYRVEKDSRKSHFLRIKEGIKKKKIHTDYGRNKKSIKVMNVMRTGPIRMSLNIQKIL